MGYETIFKGSFYFNKCPSEKLKTYIRCDNAELYDALFGWIEVLIRDKKTYLNYPLIQKFQQDLFTYTKGNLELALEIVATATLYGYRDCGWAIKMYEQNRISSVSSSVKEVSSKETLAKEEY